METTDYTFLSPVSLPKAKKAKGITSFVLGTIVAITCTSESIETNALINQNLTGFDGIVCPAIPNIKKDKILSFTVPYSEKERMLDKLSEFFCNLNKEGWDGYNAFPIESASYYNARKVVMSTPDSILKRWNVFPSPNGTISFEFREPKIAAMSVGNDEFSYVAMTDYKEPIMGQLVFDADKAAEALMAMNNLFGYSV